MHFSEKTFFLNIFIYWEVVWDWFPRNVVKECKWKGWGKQ